jgi:hypothetical protein
LPFEYCLSSPWSMASTAGLSWPVHDQVVEFANSGPYYK